jgi:hypothetical protein
MPEVLSANKVSNVVKEGFERLKSFRKIRAMFIKDYVSQYMLEQTGLTGEKPLSLVFLAIRSLVPNLVMRNPANKVTTKILAQKDYGELLGLGLNELQEQLRMKAILRAACVDMCFGLAVLKTSVAAGGLLLPLEPDTDIDPGQIYTDLISGDDLVFDPVCRQLDKATFIGHRIEIPRQKLLDADGWDKDLVKELPSILSKSGDNERAEDISKQDSKAVEMKALQDYVAIVELYFPEANAIAYIPDPYQTSFDDFLKIQDYYGPATGPYSFGSLTPPVPDNPLPVAPVGVWRDIGDMANNLFKKLMDQADRQKDVLLYPPAMADVAQAIIEARSGEAIQSSDPSLVNLVSFGGRDSNVDRMISSLSYWWNILSGNPMQMGGYTGGGATGTATEFQGLQGNLSVGLNDMRDMVCDLAADVSAKQAWFMMHDPLIKMPLFKRETNGREIQIWLTPEQRRGSWENYTFEIVKRSMQVMDPVLRAKNIMEFYTNVLPAVASAAMQMMQMGLQFNMPRALMQAAEELGISESLVEVFNDPTFQQRLEMYIQMGPQPAGKGMVNPKAVRQQGGFSMQRPVLTPGQEFNQNAQATAAIGQSAMRTI